MENGVGVVDENHVVEMSAAGNGAFDERVEKKLVGASHESKDSGGDDVFEEAVGTLEQLRTIAQSVFLDEDAKVGMSPDLGSVEVEAEAFEEAVGAPGVFGNGEVGTEVPDTCVDGEMEVLKDGEEVAAESGVVVEKSENGDSENLNLEGRLVHEKSENGDAGKVKEEFDSLCLDKSDGEILLQDGLGEELKDNLAKSSTEHHDAKIVDLENSVDRHQDDRGEDTGDNLNALDTEFRCEGVGEVKDASDIPDSGLGKERGEVKDASAISDFGLGGVKVEEVKDASANLVIEREENRSREQKDISGIIHSGHPDNGGIVDETSNSLHASAEEGKVTSEIESASSVEHSNVEKNEKIQCGVSDLGAQDVKGPQPQHASENVKACNSSSVVEEPKSDAGKDGEKKQNAEGNREPEIKPTAGNASLLGKSANPSLLPAHPAGLGRGAPLLEPAPRAVQQPRANGSVSQVQAQLVEDPTNGEAEETDETREKLQMIRVKFLRLAHRLGQTPHNVVVAQVLYRLGLAEQLRGRTGGRAGAFSFDRASAMAEHLEAAGQEPLDFSCTIMVLGKTGVGKSATINSIFDEIKFGTDAFQLGTKKVQDVVGTVQGIKVRVIDTPGLLPSSSDRRQNEKILHSVKQFIKKSPPDIVLYLDRLDMPSREFGDMPLLRTITEIFGPSIWFNAIVVLTHAASAPPEGPNGTAPSYDMFVTQRSHIVQQAIRQAAGDMRLMNPVSLVENHLACRTNRAGQRVLPNGQVWKPHLLLLSFASKILAEANTLLKLQDSPPGRPFAARARAPPLPFLLSSLLQSRPQLKLPEEQFGDEDTLDEDLDESSDSEDESEYDELPPFKLLTKTQLEKLTKAQKKAYYDELEYREKLFMKKQLKEEKRRRKMIKRMADQAKDLPGEYTENVEEESGGAASVPVPMADLPLPSSFDSDNPTHRYRYLDSSNQWLVRPVLETHGWDHDVGYEGINVERLFVVQNKMPLSFSGQVTKDKKDANLQMEVASSIKHGEGKATLLGFDMQSVGKDMAYTLRSETRFSNYRRNKATAGLSVTLLGDALSAGVKLEDKVVVNKSFQLVVTGGAMAGRGDVAYGGSLEATLRDKDYPLGRSLSTLGLSIMDWHGDLAIGCNIQSQIPIGRSTNMIARANLNNRGAGQVSIRLNSSEQLQIALIGLIPLFRKLLGLQQQIPYGQ
ncbi:translocase of chloroplast 120, chloroplastic-like [Malania oleifera]|uniref:translocase of chloroplast 120, chloroplastic-like n=1 Tax=Malania oleifera TaxID=397392 RepID=UPI0025AE995F|nr:translocase of chloroplast 120, chloroplastic-like [Malania oleifera]